MSRVNKTKLMKIVKEALGNNKSVTFRLFSFHFLMYHAGTVHFITKYLSKAR